MNARVEPVPAPIRVDFVYSNVGEEAARLAMEHRDPGIRVISDYFLGQEDRNMFTGCFGSGYFIYVDGAINQISEYNPETFIMTLESGTELLLDGEPSFELFMAIFGTYWDHMYRDQWMNDSDRTDYVPTVYRTRADFVSRAGELYHPYRV